MPLSILGPEIRILQLLGSKKVWTYFLFAPFTHCVSPKEIRFSVLFVRMDAWRIWEGQINSSPTWIPGGSPPPRHCPRRCHRLGRCTRTTTSAWQMCSPWSQSCLPADRLKYQVLRIFFTFIVDDEMCSGYLWHFLFHFCMRFICSSTSFLQ